MLKLLAPHRSGQQVAPNEPFIQTTKQQKQQKKKKKKDGSSKPIIPRKISMPEDECRRRPWGWGRKTTAEIEPRIIVSAPPRSTVHK